MNDDSKLPATTRLAAPQGEQLRENTSEAIHRIQEAFDKMKVTLVLLEAAKLRNLQQKPK
ncbi:MAG TPA: hypothetical protein VFB72_19430 [Verrucomicrobiae bacterium]|nr:hypothetical protein [Verrucomicrobiae bacterium]